MNLRRSRRRWSGTTGVATVGGPKRTATVEARKAAKHAAATAKYRRDQASEEEVARAFLTAAKQGCTVSLSKDREVCIAVLNDPLDGVTAAHNRSLELAAVDVVGKWLRQAVAK